MKRKSFVIALAASGLFFYSCSTKNTEQNETEASDSVPKVQSTSASPVHWGYGGESGPSKWSSLTPVYALCGEGQSQSPINIVESVARTAGAWNFDYKTTSLRIAHNEHMEEIIDNGHTIQVTVDEGSTFTFGDKAYELKQFHFHTPSEHTIDGKHAPMEMHMVHQNEDGSLAVVGILFREGDTPNENFAKIVANLPNSKGEEKHLQDVNLELEVHLPKHNYAYHYLGSLTTPPCSEGVQWLVLQEPVVLTKDQIAEFSKRIGPNNRPTQQVNERTVNLGDLAGNSQQ